MFASLYYQNAKVYINRFTCWNEGALWQERFQKQSRKWLRI